MSTENQNWRWTYQPNGVSTSFTYDNLVLAGTDLIVRGWLPSGAPMALPAYTVTGVGNKDGGTVVFNSAPVAIDGAIIEIKRDTAKLQGQTFKDFMQETAQVRERLADRAMLAAQEARGELGRVIGLSPLDPPGSRILPPVAALVGKYLYINASGEWEGTSLPPEGAEPSELPVSVPNLAAFKALIRRPSSVLVETGQTAGQWYWSPGDFTPGNDSTVVECTTGEPGRYRKINDYGVSVRSFGAVGDGVTDDLAAWNACQTFCQAARTTMLVPAGVYALSDSPDTITSVVTIRGEGEWCTFLLQKGVNKNGLSFDLNYATGGGIDGLSIHAEATNPGATRSTGIGLKVCRANGAFWARNFDINGFATGVQERSCFYTFFSDFQILNASTVGIHNAPKGAYTYNSAGVWFVDAKVSNYGTSSPNGSSKGILVESGAGNHYVALDCTSFADGVVLKPAAGSFIVHLFFARVLADTSENNGWIFDATNGTIVNIQNEGCWSGFNTAGHGVKFIGTNTLDDVRWNGGAIRENGRHGIYAESGSNIRFLGVSIAANSKQATLTYSGVFLAGDGPSSIGFSACSNGNFSSSATHRQLHCFYVDNAVTSRLRINDTDCIGPGAGGVPLYIGSAAATVLTKNNWPQQANIDLVGGEIIRGVTSSVAPGSTVYLGPLGQAVEPEASYVAGHACNARRIFIAAGPPGTGESYTYTLRKNGVATALTCTSMGAATFFATAAGDVDFSINDSISLELITSAGAAATPHRWSIELSG